MFRSCLLLVSAALLLSCGGGTPKDPEIQGPGTHTNGRLQYATGLQIVKEANGITVIHVKSPWPDAREGFRYALVPKELAPVVTLDRDAYDAIVTIPVERVVVTSTTHIPALVSLGKVQSIAGFPGTGYISSPEARARVKSGEITDIGVNEAINTEMVLELQPDLVIGFAISSGNKAYGVVQQSGIPVVYNGDWTEESPLGKAEWIKFFAPFFGLEKMADSLFIKIESDYLSAREIAAGASEKPSVLSGALYKDVWYLPGGASWAARFLEDANANYLWRDNDKAGSLSLSVESVISRGAEADYWISPSQYTSYEEMENANRHYSRFKAFRNKKVYTFAKTRGESGGYEYYELAPNRPDLVLKDLIHILHPGLLPEHEPYFFKPLD